MPAGQPWQRNLLLMNIISFARTFLIIMPIFVPLMQSYGLTMQQTMLLQSIFAGVTLILELPSGYIADRFGRKQTLVLGYLLAGLGFSQVIWADTFAELALFELTLGCAMSLISGSDTALAFESEKALGGPEDHAAIPRMISWMNFGEGTAALCAFVLVTYDVRLILWVQAIMGWIPFLACYWLTEPPNRTTLDANQSAHGAWLSFRQSPTVILLTLVFVVCMSTTYLATWLNQSLWQSYRLPLEYFGLVWGLFSMTIAIAARYGSRLPVRLGRLGPFSMLSVLLVAAYLALNSHQLGLIIFGGLLIALFRGFTAPKIKVAINRAIDNEYRATVNSIVASGFRVAILVLGPLMGLSVDLFGSDTAAALLILIILPAIIGLFLLDRQVSHQAIEENDLNS